MRSMAELANPLPRGARAIGFNAFGWVATFFECAWVVLIGAFCGAVPPSILILLCFMRSHHELMDRTHHMLVIQMLPSKPFVLYELPCQLVAKRLESREGIGLAEESICEVRIYLTHRDYK